MPDGGHGVLEMSSCARRAVVTFLAGGARSGRCGWRADTVRPWPLTPRPDAKVGKADLVKIASQTLWDVRRRVALRVQARRGDAKTVSIIGGLRGGQIIARGRRLTLHKVELYPDIPVTGRLRPDGVLTVGTLGEVRVDARGRVRTR